MPPDEKPTEAWSIGTINERWHRMLRPIGTLLVDVFHYVGLFVIGAATVWAAGWAFVEMLQKKSHATVEDLLLLFIFLEIGAMVGVYFKTNHMPVRFLLYVAITAVTRHLIGFREPPDDRVRTSDRCRDHSIVGNCAAGDPLCLVSLSGGAATRGVVRHRP